MTFETFVLLVLAAYAVQAVLLLYGLRKGLDNNGASRPTVSIVIAARNEQENIRESAESALQQTYPKELFEVIVVDDESSDHTGMILEELRVQHTNLKVVRALPNRDLRGKPNALAQGIDVASGEVVMITDADCVVPKTWVESTARRFTEGVGLIGGITLQRATDPFTGMQSLDWAYLLGMASATASLHYPLGSIGNNLSFRKAAYEDIGGYRKLRFSVTEDYTLVQGIIRTGRWKYLYPVDPTMVVESKPCPDWQTLIRQKQRWGKGGLDMKLGGFGVMVVGFLMHTTPFILLYWGDIIVVSAILMAKVVLDYIFLYQVLKRLQRTAELRYFYWFELYFLIYVVYLPFLVFFGGKVRWKDRTF